MSNGIFKHETPLVLLAFGGMFQEHSDPANTVPLHTGRKLHNQKRSVLIRTSYEAVSLTTTDRRQSKTLIYRRTYIKNR